MNMEVATVDSVRFIFPASLTTYTSINSGVFSWLSLVLIFLLFPMQLHRLCRWFLAFSDTYFVTCLLFTFEIT